MTYALSTLALLFALGSTASSLGAQAAAAASSGRGAPGVPSIPGSLPGSEPSLEEVRAATERFRDVQIALAEGYLPDPMNLCDAAETMGKPAELGAMGIHYFRPDLLGIQGPPNPRIAGTGTHTDFRKPAILIYEPQQSGALELVAVENLTFVKAWEAAGNQAPPSFHGVPFDRMEDDPATEVDEAHGFEPHFDRHVWLYRDNPNGMFAQYNPTVTCKHHKQTATHGH